MVDNQSGQTLGSFTFTRIAEANAAIATALADGLDAVPGLNGVAGFATDGGTPEQINVLFDHPGLQYSFVLVAPAPGTLADATTQTAGGVSRDFARFIATGTPGSDGLVPIVQLGAASTADEVRGILLRPLGQFSNAGSGVAADDDAVLPGRGATMAFGDEILMRNVGSVVGVDGGLVHVVRNVAGGQEIGTCRADADGANTVVLGITQAYWADTTQPGELGPVRLRL